MKFKKIISNILTVGLLFNSGISSFAGVLSEDGRYETFEGNNITIDNVLEEDKVDVEIGGNTLINLLDSVNYNVVVESGEISNVNVISNKNYLKVTTNGDLYNGSSSYMYINLGMPNLKMLKPNTKYTVIGDIIKGVDSIGILSGNGVNHIATFSKVNDSKSVLTTIDNFNIDKNQILYAYLGNYKTVPIDIEIKNVMLLEGDWTNKEIPEYFEGMKSVGELEDNKLKVISLPNENLLPESDLKFITTKDKEHSGYFLAIDNKVARNFINKELTLSFDVHSKGEGKNSVNNPNFTGDNNINRFGAHGQIYWKSSTDSNIGIHTYPLVLVHNYERDKERVSVTSKIVAPEGYDIMQSFGISIQPFRMPSDNNNEEWYLSNFKLEYGSKATPWIPNINETIYSNYIEKYTTKISLKEPLRGLPNGVKDRIIKRNGQWVVERNCKEIILNGSENWFIDTDRNNDSTTYFRTYDFISTISHSSDYDGKTDFFLNDKYIENTPHNNWSSVNTDKPSLDVNKNIIVSIREEKMTLSEFKAKLKNNPVKVIYQLVNPIYEPLNIDLSIQLFEGMTHISNNSNIPATMEITIDRTINRAVEAIELAKVNPTIENISLARMWTNLLKETINKDNLQGEINIITNIKGLELEKKSVTANVDIYIKSENSLSMTLSTNSIMFEDYSGVSDIEKLNALEITVNSSLPYDLNAYLESEIQNSDKSTTIDSNLLQIKESKDLNYKTFANTVDKVILEEDCPSGNYNKHNIDLKMEGSNAYKADVYKTVIKFEAEQK